MENQIPQSFKVQWLNTTLKFIKDDTQLVKDYPKMPASHVEYLHNLIWKRQNDVGLGFKSLYSPVWEAMKIHSLKYQFKIVVEKSDDGESGHLKMEKIPKTGQPTKKLYNEKKDNKNTDYMADTKNTDEKKDKKDTDEKKNMDEKKDNKNTDEKKDKDNETILNDSATKAVKCKQLEVQSKKVKTKKPIPKMSKGLKNFMENKKILDFLSPLFIKTTLRSILDFINDESSASKIFSNLAPIESRFLENFFSICQKKDDFQVLLPPACNDMLAEMSNRFKDFSKTCRLDISVLGVNTNNRREVQFTKVPVFNTRRKPKQKLKENSVPTQTETSKDPPKLVNTQSLSKEESNVTLKNVSKEILKTKSNKDIKNNATGEDRKVIKSIDEVINTIDNNIIEALSKVVKKTDDVKPNSYLKDKSLNKSVLQPKKSICFTKEGTSSTAAATYIGVKHKSPTMKILQDMSVPLTSDKALRMMQLMGWKGGALGLRGEGITEPIIPIPNFNGSGLGHVPVKVDSNQKETKKHLRTEFVKKIIEMIDKDIKMSVIKLQNKLIKRETKFWKHTLKIINKRLNLDADFDDRDEVKDKMVKNSDLHFIMDFEDDHKKIILKKTNKTAMKTRIQVNKNTKKENNSEENNTNAIKNPNSEAGFKTIILKSILELINSEDNEKVVQLNKDLKSKHINYSNKIILQINERKYVKPKKSSVVAALGSQILEEIGDNHLSFKTDESERYIVLQKKQLQSKVNEVQNTVVNKTDSDGNIKSAFDTVRTPLPTKKKHKLLNALYKYEMVFTEEFKENKQQWYNTVDKSLIDSKITLNINNDDKKIKNNNNETENNNNINFMHDQNNNGDIAVNVKITSKNDNSENIIPKSELFLQVFDKVQGK